jgi:hypothetical protein
MTVLAGGLRSRMIFDNLYNLIQSNLTALGWFESGLRFQPIVMVNEQQDTTTPVQINTLAVADAPVSSVLWEVGSELTEDTRWYFVDFFGESDALAKHVIGDVRDILLGKFASIGLSAPVLPVYDLRQPTPPFLFSCQITNMRQDRAHTWSHPWERHWYSLHFSLLDYYNVDTDVTVYNG